ncbi:uncharacterized protein CTHT_0038220 [Thermochaetoides thermophila DSM 1495]|uniref:Uncharacterized protein n=1 Tax=Chaetomium thermophilum (strain DSM 1495 / CBS 144.50 / IMI 039719) TaxID=759272 RepID=G0S8B2_CHATD|nr:hypothetical protein CTHT_0038220 [Thermochaetoides thermophila DSM 1495]EGS21946.1 hypothetical protein CTHT_0038220 [Thermochaetoides thermophila DSM 1495]
MLPTTATIVATVCADIDWVALWNRIPKEEKHNKDTPWDVTFSQGIVNGTIVIKGFNPRTRRAQRERVRRNCENRNTLSAPVDQPMMGEEANAPTIQQPLAQPTTKRADNDLTPAKAHSQRRRQTDSTESRQNPSFTTSVDFKAPSKTVEELLTLDHERPSSPASSDIGEPEFCPLPIKLATSIVPDQAPNTNIWPIDGLLDFTGRCINCFAPEIDPASGIPHVCRAPCKYCGAASSLHLPATFPFKALACTCSAFPC